MRSWWHRSWWGRGRPWDQDRTGIVTGYGALVQGLVWEESGAVRISLGAAATHDPALILSCPASRAPNCGSRQAAEA